MWVADLEATLDLVPDLVQGGERPYIFNEVIDQGGEPIKVQEYFSCGRVTEFRYCTKIAEPIRNGNYAALGAVYDPGWGMADQEHAFVFVDNHDNQRSHGGGGNVLTHMEPYLYKLGVSFMLAHDYGEKRVMSSYYFDDSDQGPPSSPPGCGVGWACEHRWKSIGNMVEFANAVYGEPVSNWVGESNMVAFSRGSKGFYAMGNLGRTFFTGLPDGDYCDIISDCQQTITISGGSGYFALHDSDEPVVAICVGCGGASATDATTAATTTTTTTVTTTTTTLDPTLCCDEVTLSSEGGIDEYLPELLGDYVKIDEDVDGRPIFQHTTILTQSFLHYTVDPVFKWEGWQVTLTSEETFGYIASEDEAVCPVNIVGGWEYYVDDEWVVDDSFRIECTGIEGTTVATTSGSGGTTRTTASGGGSTTRTTTGGVSGGTTQPPPEGMARTIIFIEKTTVPGSDVFIVGGVSEDQRPGCTNVAETSECSVAIELNPLPLQWLEYNTWMEGDTVLDWEGPQEDQATHNTYPAMGTAAGWTTDDDTDDYHHELNTFGPHHWIIDVQMDCSQTERGWFEFNTIFSIGGESGEVAISQLACTGDVGGVAPFPSQYHVGRCGFMNVFSYGVGTCQIDDIPALQR